MMKLKDMQEKYDFFLRIYKQGVKEYIPFYELKEKGIKEWSSGKCKRVQKSRDEAWTRMKRKPIQERKEQFQVILPRIPFAPESFHSYSCSLRVFYLT